MLLLLSCSSAFAVCNIVLYGLRIFDFIYEDYNTDHGQISPQHTDALHWSIIGIGKRDFKHKLGLWKKNNPKKPKTKVFLLKRPEFTN